MSRSAFSALQAICLCGLLSSCGQEAPAPAPAGYGGYGYGDPYGYGTGEITFLDQAPANAAPETGFSELTFTSAEGVKSQLREHVGERAAVIVVTRGNTNPICPYCSTQTANYIRDYEEFRRRGAEVLLVYPIASFGDRDRLTAFLSDARTRLGDANRPVPFPVLFDVELAAVTQLGIRQDLSKPATYIVDRDGTVRYAYVGAHWGDRPSVKAVLAELDKLPGGVVDEPTGTPPAPDVPLPDVAPAEASSPPVGPPDADGPAAGSN